MPNHNHIDQAFLNNRMKVILFTLLSAGLACQKTEVEIPSNEPYVVVLGVTQDAGYPQADCRKDCCKPAWENPSLRKQTVSLGIVDPQTGERWVMDATPDFKNQLWELNSQIEKKDHQPLSGVLLTHAHIGHYTGLMHLGFEAIGAKGVPVYAMPRMSEYLATSGPWDQLVRMKHIEIIPLADGVEIDLNGRIRVRPFLVPHRDEYSETVGYHIKGPKKSVIYIPDVDKWEKWHTRIEEVIANCDRAYIDGSFYFNDEVKGRDMSEFPHPFIVESMARFGKLPDKEKKKITFIHFNHTNPVLRKESKQAKEVLRAGFRLARQGEKILL